MMTKTEAAPENPAAMHDKYRVQVCMAHEVILKLAIPGNKSRLHVIDVARRELARTSTATHATVRDLSGKEIEVYANDSWLQCQFKALRLNRKA